VAGRLGGFLVALVVAGAGVAPAVATAAPEAPPPRLESSTPADGARLGRAPASVTMRFSEPLGPGSTISVTDDCGRRLDDGNTQVTGSEMEVGIVEKPSGHYTASYLAEGTEEGSGSTEGSIGFDVGSGKHCGTPEFESSEPRSASILREAPRFVTIRFSAALAGSSTIEVVDQCGRRVDSGDTRVSDDEMTVSLVGRPSGHYIASYFARGAIEGSGSTSGEISFHANEGPDCGGKGAGHNHGDGDGNHKGRHDPSIKHEDEHTPQDHASGDHSPSDHSLTDPDHTTAHTSTHSGPTHSDATHEGSGSHGKERGHHGHPSGSHGGAASATEEPSSEEGLAIDPAIVPTAGAVLAALALALGLGIVGGLLLRTYATS